MTLTCTGKRNMETAAGQSFSALGRDLLSIFSLLGMDTWYANMGPAHPLYDREGVTIQELLQYPFVRRPDGYFSNLTHYLKIDGVRLTNFSQVVYANDSAAIFAILRPAYAFRFGPGLSAGDFAAYGIRTIPHTQL